MAESTSDRHGKNCGSGATCADRIWSGPEQPTESPVYPRSAPVGESPALVPYRVADDVMTFPKMSLDGKVNIAQMAIIVAGIMAIGVAQAQLNALVVQNQDQEVRIRGLENTVATSLASIEERLKGVDRIERRLEKGQ